MLTLLIIVYIAIMPLNVEELSNTYHALRHGRSKPNEDGIIISDLERGKDPMYGLVVEGRDQVRISVRRALETNVFKRKKKIILHSPFSRAYQSAEVAGDELDVDLIECEDLRERYFGVLDGLSHVNYQAVWNRDQIYSGHTQYGVESVRSTRDRGLRVIQKCEENYEDSDIILVGHGDSLQILETVFRGIHASLHRTLKSLKNGELRQLN